MRSQNPDAKDDPAYALRASGQRTSDALIYPAVATVNVSSAVIQENRVAAVLHRGLPGDAGCRFLVGLIASDLGVDRT